MQTRSLVLKDKVITKFSPNRNEAFAELDQANKDL